MQIRLFKSYTIFWLIGVSIFLPTIVRANDTAIVAQKQLGYMYLHNITYAQKLFYASVQQEVQQHQDETTLAKEQSTFLWPVKEASHFLKQYGEKGAYESLFLNGILIAAKEQKTLIAPYEGRIVFHGQFRGYGQLIIIDHQNGYHTLLSGMKEIFTFAEPYVTRGQPLGILSDIPLYMEMRYHGKTIDPSQIMNKAIIG